MKKEVRISKDSTHWVVAFYYIGAIVNPAQEAELQKQFLSHLDVSCRLYVAKDGLNGQMCFVASDAKKYMDWMLGREQFSSIHFKAQGVDCHVFPRCTIKVRRELVALGTEVDFSKRGTYLSPEDWKAKLEDDSQEKIIIDTRNDYEWQLGHFENAELLPYETFKDFREYAKGLKERIDSKNSQVLMYCTGGIRCELFSALLKEEGIDDVYQLQGGVINYGQEAGSKHWKGSLFVFDDRLSVPISEEPVETIGTCLHCKEKIENYYNCANMDCNELFLCCHQCLEKHQGCCSSECQSAPRVRPFSFAHTPFRRWYNYAAKKDELSSLNPKYVGKS